MTYMHNIHIRSIKGGVESLELPPVKWEDLDNPEVSECKHFTNDVRNPRRIPGLKWLDGREPEVQRVVQGCGGGRNLINHILYETNFFLSPHRTVPIAIQMDIVCRTGKVVGPAVAELVAKQLRMAHEVEGFNSNPPWNVVVEHPFIGEDKPRRKLKEVEPIFGGHACRFCRIPFCEKCGYCETDGCKGHARSISSTQDAMECGLLQPRSQKVSGVMALQNVGHSSIAIPRPLQIIQNKDDIVVFAEKCDKLLLGSIPWFVRPCPVTPRHGFVDSRELVRQADKKATAALLGDIFTETLAADPEAELMLSQFYPSIMNAVITPNTITVGGGHDGATGGHEAISIPLVPIHFKEVQPHTLEEAGIDVETQDPYIEAVGMQRMTRLWDAYQPSQTSYIIYTQLRSGPKVPASMGVDYMPTEMRVEQIIRAEGDLLAWEKRAAGELKQPGVVVDHTGGSLTSHYGVHCVFNGIPVMTSRVPVVGETLVPSLKATEPDPEAVVRGLMVGAFGVELSHSLHLQNSTGPAYPIISTSNAAAAVAAVLHNAPAMGGEAGFYIGVAAALMLRLGMAASHGEARHAVNRHQEIWKTRNFVYDASINGFLDSRDTLGIAQHRFLFYGWKREFGGAKWAECTESVFELDARCRDLMRVVRQPDLPETTSKPQDAVAAIILALNRSVQKAHNGGWWLNKFVTQDAFDLACEHSLHTMMIMGYVGRAARAVVVEEGLIQRGQAWMDAEDIKIREFWSGPEVDPEVIEAQRRVLELDVDMLVEVPKVQLMTNPPTLPGPTGEYWWKGPMKVGAGLDEPEETIFPGEPGEVISMPPQLSPFPPWGPVGYNRNEHGLPPHHEVQFLQIRKCGPGLLRLQYRLKGYPGYFSQVEMVSLPEEVWETITSLSTHQSWAKSQEMYMMVEGVEMYEPTVIRFKVNNQTFLITLEPGKGA